MSDQPDRVSKAGRRGTSARAQRQEQDMRRADVANGERVDDTGLDDPDTDDLDTGPSSADRPG